MSALDPRAHAIARAAEEARRRIAGIVRETPLEPSLAQGGLLLKLEQLQHTGSFKLRGAAAKLTALDEAARARGVVTASTGNHGLAVTYAARAVGSPAPRVHVPASADPSKVERLRALGADVVVSGAGCVDAERAARDEASATGRAYVSPYNDEDVVAGQGTLGLELAEQARASGRTLDVVYVAVGGGGLVSGLAAALKATMPRVRIVGCLPENSQGMLASVRAGRAVDVPESPTLSDATAGGVEPDSITLPLCAALVDEWRTVTEEEIREAWRALFTSDRWVVEGAAAVALAAAHQAPRGERANAAVVLCGRNVGAAQLAALV